MKLNPNARYLKSHEWARKEGYNVEIEEINDGEWEIVIEKTK